MKPQMLNAVALLALSSLAVAQNEPGKDAAQPKAIAHVRNGPAVLITRVATLLEGNAF